MTDTTNRYNATLDSDQTDATATAPAAPRPRIRVGAIVWGMIVCITAATTLIVVSSQQHRAAFGDWLGELTPDSVGILVLVAAGILLLLLGLVSLIRQAQRRTESR